jgi:hypothetical protein
MREFRSMGIEQEHIVISTNLPTQPDGLPSSGINKPVDSGVALYWVDMGQTRCMAIDRHDTVQQNMRALAATIQALRAIERHGGNAMLDRALTGFIASRPPITVGSRRHWRAVLDYGDGIAEMREIIRGYRLRARFAHPDRGGSDAAMAELNQARDEALLEAT